PEGILLDVIGYHVTEPAGALLPQQINVVYPGSVVSYGNVGPISVSATSGLPVTLTSSTPAVCGATDTIASIVGIGTCTMTASQAGNTVFKAAPTVTITITVLEGTQTISFAPLLDHGVSSGAVSLSAASTSGLPVTFTSATAATCSVSGSTVAPIA